MAFSPQANYTDQATADCRRSCYVENSDGKQLAALNVILGQHNTFYVQFIYILHNMVILHVSTIIFWSSSGIT
jgi:hypothetical protein